jgi:hypothetical protein
MVVSVERDLLARWQNGSNVLLRVRSPEDPVRLRAALTAARREIAALGPDTGSGAAGPAYLSPLIPVPDGQLMIVDFGRVPPATVRAVPELVARHLTDGGIRDAVVDTPQRIGDRYATVTAFAPSARAWLRGPLGVPFGPAARDAPGYLLDLVVEWVRGEQPATQPIGVIVSAELALAWSTVSAALSPALATGSSVAVVASDFRTSAVAGAVQGRFGGTVPQASLTVAGPGWQPAAFVAAMARQRDALRAHAGRLLWAGVTVSPDARDTLSAVWNDREPPAGPGINRPPGDRLADVLVPDGMWYQILSPGHIARLSGPPPEAATLPDGRVELTIGAPEQWLPGHPDRPAVVARARELLAGCLVDEATAQAMSRERLATARASDTTDFFGHPG